MNVKILTVMKEAPDPKEMAIAWVRSNLGAEPVAIVELDSTDDGDPIFAISYEIDGERALAKIRHPSSFRPK